MDKVLDKICIVNNHKDQKKVFDDPAQYKIVVSGRQFGKSTLLGEEALRVCYSIPKSISYLVSPTFEMGRVAFWDKLIDRADALNWDYRLNKHEFSLTKLSNGSKIFVKSAVDPDRLRGATLDFAGIDEFREMDERIWFEIIEPALTVKKGKAVFCSTPNGHDAIYRLYMIGQDKTQSTYKSWLFASYDSPFLSKESIEAKKKFTDEKTYRQEYEASFEVAEGLVYYSFNRVMNIRPLEIDYNLPLRISFDFNVSPMTTSICQIVQGNKDKKEQDKVLNIIHTINTHNSNTMKQCKELKMYLERIKYNGELYFYGDAAGNQRSANSNYTNWELIRQEFPNGYYKVPDKDPAISDRVNCVNVKLFNADEEIGVYINNENCNELLRDFEELLYDGNEISKKNKMLTHNSDNVGYLIHKEFPVKAKRDLSIHWL